MRSLRTVCPINIHSLSSVHICRILCSLLWKEAGEQAVRASCLPDSPSSWWVRWVQIRRADLALRMPGLASSPLPVQRVSDSVVQSLSMMNSVNSVRFIPKSSRSHVCYYTCGFGIPWYLLWFGLDVNVQNFLMLNGNKINHKGEKVYKKTEDT